MGSGRAGAKSMGRAGRRGPGQLAWIVWGTGVLAYTVAVLHRTSLGVAGLAAAERYDTSASTLATLAVVQLLVYAGLQVPVGVAVDRVGSRVMLAGGAALMCLGQVLLGLTSDIGWAVLARLLVGAGDAMSFISVLRLIPAWFPERRVPVLTQVTGIIGQAGQILAAVPFLAFLEGPGWTAAFLTAAGFGGAVGLLVIVVIRNAPGKERPVAAARPDVGRLLREAWRHPGTRLGMWSHFGTQFSGMSFALLWGYPFLLSAQGLERSTASALFTGFVLVSMVVGPVIGFLTSRHPLRRSWLVLAIIGITTFSWTVLLARSEPAPLWLLSVHLVVLALGGPGSLIGFDYARSFNPVGRLGTASGIVNVGGFVASLSTILLVGIVLDIATGGGGEDYSLDAFRLAFCVQYPIWLIGVIGIMRTRTLVRARIAEEGVVVPPLREALRRNRQARAERRPE